MIRVTSADGHSLIELIFVGWLVAVISAIAIPQLLACLDDQRTLGAVRYLTTWCARARMEAITRSRDVAIHFSADSRGYVFAVYVDGNDDGVRTRDIQRGTDFQVARPERLSANFPGVEFAVPSGLPAVDGGSPTDGDPLKVGSANLLSFTPLGTSSSGSLYVRGRDGSQYVVRAFGETGKIRSLKFDERTRRWNPI